MRPTLLAAAGMALATAVPAAAQLDITINVGTDSRNGTCRVYFPRDDGMELEISVRAEDGNTNVAVHNIPSEWIDGNEDKDIAISLATGGSTKFKTEGGAYRAGFTYRGMGYFAEADGPKVAGALKGGKTFAVVLDGHDVGAFEIQQSSATIKDYAYNFMKRCVTDAGGTANF